MIFSDKNRIEQRISMLFTNIEAWINNYYNLYLLNYDDTLETQQSDNTACIKRHEIPNLNKYLNMSVKQGEDNPIRNVYGDLADLYVDTVHKSLWVCVQEGYEGWYEILTGESMNAHNTDADAHKEFIARAGGDPNYSFDIKNAKDLGTYYDEISAYANTAVNMEYTGDVELAEVFNNGESKILSRRYNIEGTSAQIYEEGKYLICPSDSTISSTIYREAQSNKISFRGRGIVNPYLLYNGKITNSGGRLWGFNRSSYPYIDKPFQPGNRPWEMVWKFNYINNGGYQAILAPYYTAPYGNILITVTPSNTLEIRMSSDGASWDFTILSANISSGATYYLKVRFTGSQYIASISSNGTSYTDFGTINSTTPIYQLLGFSIGTEAYINQKLWYSYIDVNESYINIDGEPWWGSSIAKQLLGGYIHDRFRYIEIDKVNNCVWFKQFGKNDTETLRVDVLSMPCGSVVEAEAIVTPTGLTGNVWVDGVKYTNSTIGSMIYNEEPITNIYMGSFPVSLGGVSHWQGILDMSGFELDLDGNNAYKAIVYDNVSSNHTLVELINEIERRCSEAGRSISLGNDNSILSGNVEQGNLSIIDNSLSGTQQNVVVGDYYIPVGIGDVVKIELIGGGGGLASRNGGIDEYSDTQAGWQYYHSGGGGAYFKGTFTAPERGNLKLVTPASGEANHTKGGDAVAYFVNEGGYEIEVARASGGDYGAPSVNAGFLSEVAGGRVSYNTEYITSVDLAINGTNGVVYSQFRI